MVIHFLRRWRGQRNRHDIDRIASCFGGNDEIAAYLVQFSASALDAAKGLVEALRSDDAQSIGMSVEAVLGSARNLQAVHDDILAQRRRAQSAVAGRMGI